MSMNSQKYGPKPEPNYVDQNMLLVPDFTKVVSVLATIFLGVVFAVGPNVASNIEL